MTVADASTVGFAIIVAILAFALISAWRNK